MTIRSQPYTMPARGQDAWFRPLTPIPLTESRWVRAVEMRPATAAGRRITHHALALLQQEEPGSNTGVQTQGLLMEGLRLLDEANKEAEDNVLEA